MKQKNNFDDFDNMLFEYYNKNKEIPHSTKEIIQNSFSSQSNKVHSIYTILLKRIAILLLSVTLITATTAFAINIINKIFTNSNTGIDSAVEHGYVQNVDMDFITDNNIGIKVDYILMDNTSLDISFVYKYFNQSSSITNLKYTDIAIKDEQENIICLVSENYTNNKEILGTSINSYNEQEVLDTTTVRDSLLVTSEQFPTSKVLYIEITKMLLVINNETHYVTGNWSFSINLDTKFASRTLNEYNSTDSPYIDNVTATLSNTSLEIKLELNTEIDNSIVLKRNNIILTDENNVEYKCSKVSAGNNIDPTQKYVSLISLSYPITSYDNINKLFLHLNIDSNKFIDIELYK